MNRKLSAKNTLGKLALPGAFDFTGSTSLICAIYLSYIDLIGLALSSADAHNIAFHFFFPCVLVTLLEIALSSGSFLYETLCYEESIATEGYSF